MACCNWCNITLNEPTTDIRFIMYQSYRATSAVVKFFVNRLIVLKTNDKSLEILLTEVTGDLDLDRYLHKSSQTTQFNINNNFAKL
jgi:hypothetical protein